MNLLKDYTAFIGIEKLSISAVLFILYFIIKYNIKKNLIKSDDRDYELKVDQRKRLINFFKILFSLLILIIWFTEVQNFIISILAVAAALVLATKELIMCTTGGILIKLGHGFKLKDRIEVDNIRGFVIEKGITYTKVLEIGPEKESQQTTGNILVIPNSIFLSKPLKNESYFKGYSIKTFVFPLPTNFDLAKAESFLLEKAKEIANPYRHKAKRAIGDYCKTEGLILPSIESRAKVSYGQDGKVSILLKMPIINEHIADVEQDLLRGYLDLISVTTKS